MKKLDEIKKIRSLDIKSLNADGGNGMISVNGIRCSVTFSWGGGWEHVSIAPFDHKITPSWKDMCKLKEMFWNEDEAVVQIHPRKADYVNLMKNCLHLWRPTEQDLPLPPALFV